MERDEHRTHFSVSGAPDAAVASGPSMMVPFEIEWSGPPPGTARTASTARGCRSAAVRVSVPTRCATFARRSEALTRRPVGSDVPVATHATTRSWPVGSFEL